jgi:hypothetical protein
VPANHATTFNNTSHVQDHRVPFGRQRIFIPPKYFYTGANWTLNEMNVQAGVGAGVCSASIPMNSPCARIMRVRIRSAGGGGDGFTLSVARRVDGVETSLYTNAPGAHHAGITFYGPLDDGIFTNFAPLWGNGYTTGVVNGSADHVAVVIGDAENGETLYGAEVDIAGPF